MSAIATSRYPTRFIVCGDRDWNDARTVWEALHNIPEGAVLVHGDCRGADRIAARVWESKFGGTTEPHPADWTRYRKGAGPIRNQEMLDSGVDLVIALHGDLARSRGTLDMIKRANKAGIPVILYADAAPRRSEMGPA